jgi:hypothetical protein
MGVPVRRKAVQEGSSRQPYFQRDSYVAKTQHFCHHMGMSLEANQKSALVACSTDDRVFSQQASNRILHSLNATQKTFSDTGSHSHPHHLNRQNSFLSFKQGESS